MATTSASSSKINIVIPATVNYKEENTKPAEQQANAFWSTCYTPIEKMGIVLRNAFYLPWYKKDLPSELTINQDLAKKVSDALMGGAATSSEEMGVVKDHFSIRDVAVHLQGQTTRIFNVRLFETKKPICEKNLRLILFSYNGNQERRDPTESRRWEPLTIKELSESPLLVLKAFQKSGVEVDSLVTTSLGNVMVDSFKDIPQNSDEQKAVPQILVINRGLTSVKKVANQLFSFPFNYILYGAAKLTGWNADPEQGLLDFLGKADKGREVVMIEAQEDFYFSKASGFSSDYHTKIENLGAKVFRAAFYPFPFHTRAHHALSLAHLVNNKATKQIANSARFDVESGESVASLIAKNIFIVHAPYGGFHTCFYVCGNDATLDVGTAREALPLLSAFVKEGKMMETKLTEEKAS